MCNQDVRAAIKEAGMKQWEIADALQIAESTFCRWMRKPLPEDKKAAIMTAINKRT